MRSKIGTNIRVALVFLAVWLGVFLLLYLWFVFAPDNRRWTRAVYTVVITAAVLFTLCLWSPKPNGGDAG